MTLRLFFTFFGGKWRTAPRYPSPEHATIIEPFAGSAGYSLRYPERDIILVERDPALAQTWRYILAATAAEIRRLPLAGWKTTDELDVPAGARNLIGFWLNKATTSPCKTPGAWMRNPLPGRLETFWGAGIRERIASQVDQVRHWRVIEGNYTHAPDVEATWFIDPPYVDTGHHYRFGSALLDYDQLGEWCRTRRGQVMVCEHVGADWLPFRPFLVAKSTEGRGRDGQSKEALWIGGPA